MSYRWACRQVEIDILLVSAGRWLGWLTSSKWTKTSVHQKIAISMKHTRRVGWGVWLNNIPWFQSRWQNPQKEGCGGIGCASSVRSPPTATQQVPERYDNIGCSQASFTQYRSTASQRFVYPLSLSEILLHLLALHTCISHYILYEIMLHCSMLHTHYIHIKFTCLLRSDEPCHSVTYGWLMQTRVRTSNPKTLGIRRQKWPKSSNVRAKHLKLDMLPSRQGGREVLQLPTLEQRKLGVPFCRESISPNAYSIWEAKKMITRKWHLRELAACSALWHLLLSGLQTFDLILCLLFAGTMGTSLFQEATIASLMF